MTFCIHCGTEMPDNARFCAKCGGALMQLDEMEQSNQPYMPHQGNASSGQYVGQIHLKCHNCGGPMTVDMGNGVMACQFCGSANLLNESENVAVERIKSETHKDKNRTIGNVKIFEQMVGLEKAKIEAKSYKKGERGEITLILSCVFLIVFCLASLQCSI